MLKYSILKVSVLSQWKITDSARVKCQDFADKCLDSVKDNYAKNRKQSNPEKLKFDMITGKLAELAVYDYLVRKSRFANISEPDFNIYAAKQKSFDADLFTEKWNFHVKSQHQSQSDKYGLSWIFQKSDKLTHTPKLSDIICFCTVGDEFVNVYSIRRAVDLIGLYKPLKLAHLSSKVAIYGEDLQND